VGWVLLSALVAAAIVMLLVRGYVLEGVASGGTLETTSVPALRGAGPVLDLRDDGVYSAGPTDKTVALTFDDGPDPTWTPRILQVLERHDVPATFFVVGASVVQHPEVTAEVVAAGHEVGVHTFTHAELRDLPGWRRDVEMRLTQAAIAGATGLRTTIMRPPYSSIPEAIDADALDAYRRAASDGYLLVLADQDSRDWAGADAAEITAGSMPTGGAGAVVLLHDGGGDRSETVEALDELIPRLKAQGYRFVTTSAVAGATTDEVMAPATTVDRFIGAAFLHGVGLSLSVSGGVLAVVVPLLFLFFARSLVGIALALRQVRRRRRATRGDALPPVSVLVPAHNEELGIVASVRSILASDYPEVEVVVVDDGSTDGTAGAVEEMDDPRVLLVRQANGGKPAALNTGIARASHDLLVMVDGDTTLDRDALRHLAARFADPKVGAVSGNAKVANRRGLLGLWQHLEYVHGFNLDRRMLEALDCIPTIPGAIGAYRRDVLREVGGMSSETLAEDTDLTLSILRAGWRVAYEQQAVAWTEAPVTMRALWRQRYRWSYGTMQSMWKHRGAVTARDEGRVGRRALPYLVLFQLVLPLLGPLVDLLVLYGLLFRGPGAVLPLWAAYNAAQVLVAAAALRLDRERMWPALTLPLQQLGYRQLMYLVLLQSGASALLGRRLSWMPAPRTGEVSGPGSPVSCPTLLPELWLQPSAGAAVATSGDDARR
jgi:peptidoglycan/xylan/chitin deacetylase (PgdA/CDA1 family)/glycosyltransferase involved in cell wall biosynthesis